MSIIKLLYYYAVDGTGRLCQQYYFEHDKDRYTLIEHSTIRSIILLHEHNIEHNRSNF